MKKEPLWQTIIAAKQYKSVRDETAPVHVAYDIIERGGWGRKTTYISFTRDTFDAVSAEHPHYSRRQRIFTFDAAKEAALRLIAQDIAGKQAYLRSQRERFDTWRAG